MTEPQFRINRLGEKVSKRVKRALVVLAIASCVNTLFWMFMAGAPVIFDLATANRVEVFSLQSRHEAETENGRATFKPSSNQIAYCNVIGQGKTQGYLFARRVSMAVIEPWTFLQAPTKCIMMPVVCFRAWSGASYVDVVVCFHCSQMLLIAHDAKGHETPSAVLQIWGPQSFQLQALAREALPNDSRLNPKL